MMLPNPRIVLHCEDLSCRLLDPAEIFWVEARDGRTLVHLADGEVVHDRRDLGELSERLQPLGFVRIHRMHSVNLYRVHRVIVCDNGRDLEVELDEPVARTLAVNDMGRRLLWAALGETE